VHRVDQIIFPVDVIDIEVILVVPVAWPGLGVHEPIAAVAKAAILSRLDAETVLGPEAGTKLFVADGRPERFP
jgi:hypothetical protein